LLYSHWVYWPNTMCTKPRTREDALNNVRSLSVQWRPQFNLPLNGIPGYEETVYYVDYQDARIISLNSNESPVAQKAWLEEVLKNNPGKWAIVTFHHPIYSASARRDNPLLRDEWRQNVQTGTHWLGCF